MSMVTRPRTGCSPPRCQSAGASAISVSSDSPRRRRKCASASAASWRRYCRSSAQRSAGPASVSDRVVHGEDRRRTAGRTSPRRRAGGRRSPPAPRRPRRAGARARRRSRPRERRGRARPACAPAGPGARRPARAEPRLDVRRPRRARLGHQLVEQARLALVEALGVIRVGQPQQRVVDVVTDLVQQRAQVRAEGDDPPLLGRAHPELDLRRLAALARVEPVQLAPLRVRARRQHLDLHRRHAERRR